MKQDYPPREAVLAAIRAKCLDCCGNARKVVEGCQLASCPLHPYRSLKAIGDEREHRTEISGQLDLFGVLMTKEEKAV